jgi:hypothetical protein
MSRLTLWEIISGRFEENGLLLSMLLTKAAILAIRYLAETKLHDAFSAVLEHFYFFTAP